jgi:very-short-patch-repair endonuclease
MAAVLACGPNAALSHAAAAAHLAIRPSSATLLDVTSPTGAGRGIAGIRAHRSRLAPEDIALVEGIPTTTCARTLLDLAEVVNRDALAKAIDKAEINEAFDLVELNDTMARNPGRRGLLPLRALLSSLDLSSKLTRSDFERRLLSLIRDAGIPQPEVNATLTLEGQTLEVDFLWRRERLVLEADGWQTHRTRRAFVSDRARDRLLLRAHYRTARVTWTDSASEVIATIRAALAT